jgi:hypothetical protein
MMTGELGYRKRLTEEIYNGVQDGMWKKERAMTTQGPNECGE